MRWNHRVWETDRATRLDRMGSPAKWMREHYHSSLARARPGLLRELAQVNCTSFFRAAALRGIYWGPIDFSGEKSIENSIMRFQSERASERVGVSITGALCKDTFHGRINAEMSIYLFSVENLMARIKSDFYCVS